MLGTAFEDVQTQGPGKFLPPACTLPDLGHPGAELLLVPRLKQHISSIGDLGTPQRDIRGRCASPSYPHPHVGTAQSTAPPPYKLHPPSINHPPKRK